jgi:CDP-paratose 2-epimerase
MNYALITGSAGLIGSQSVDFFHNNYYNIIGIDNNMRSYFFGENASTEPTKNVLIEKYKNYKHYDQDIRNYTEIEKIFKQYGTAIKIIIHTAAQPSHDWAAKEPITDFTVNALGTMNLLELTRLHCPNATFIFTSTNKVYGDRPNSLDIKEEDTRYECYEQNNLYSIDESMSIDNTTHSVFGASKVSADIMCQEYGKYFGIKTGIFRGGCLTGPNHAGTELHGFLSYLVKCIISNKPYTIHGYKGKQVRDNIHSFDLVNMFWQYHQNPKCGEVYNAGGGRENSCSILEVIDIINKKLQTNWNNYSISDINRIGDHIWYISNIDKFKTDYPHWNITKTLNDTLDDMINFELKRIKNGTSI